MTLYSICEFIALVSAASLIIFCSNPIYSFLLFVLCVINISFILIMLGGTFLGMTLLVVYVGAICVLFLFIIMMLRIKIVDAIKFEEKAFTALFFINIYTLSQLVNAFVLYKDLVYVYIGTSGPEDYREDPWTDYNDPAFLTAVWTDTRHNTNWLDNAEAIDNIKVIGSVLYTHFFPFFLLSGLLLFVAMVGSIFLTLSHSTDARRQTISDQVSVEFEQQLDLRYYGNIK